MYAVGCAAFLTSFILFLVLFLTGILSLRSIFAAKRVKIQFRLGSSSLPLSSINMEIQLNWLDTITIEGDIVPKP